MDHVDNLKHKLLALKQTNGKTLDKFLCSYAKDGHYKCVEILKGEADDQKLESFRIKFYQALYDHIGFHVQICWQQPMFFSNHIGQKIHWRELCMEKQRLLHCARRLILIASCRLSLYSTMQFTSKTKLLERNWRYSSTYCPYSQFHPLTARGGLVRWMYTIHHKETDC